MKNENKTDESIVSNAILIETMIRKHPDLLEAICWLIASDECSKERVDAYIDELLEDERDLAMYSGIGLNDVGLYLGGFDMQ